MCSGERQVRHINYQAHLHTEILFWTLKKPKIYQTLPKIAIKKNILVTAGFCCTFGQEVIRFPNKFVKIL